MWLKARIFLRLLPFFLSNIHEENEYFLFLIELSRIVNLLYAPIIKIDTIHDLAQLIKEHLCNFVNLFPDVNVIPKQHYMIHMPTMITQVGPLIRSSCFVFESVHNYFKQLASKQNFKNLVVSLATRHQFLECANFGDACENPNAHPLFSTERKFGVLKESSKQTIERLRQMFDQFSLLPGINLDCACNVSWVTLHGTKYCKKANILVRISADSLPEFGEINNIWIICDFVYFEVTLYKTIAMSLRYQAYQVEISDSKETYICPYERLVDFNVYHTKCSDGASYIPIKYDLNDIIDEYLNDYLLLRL